MLMLIMHFLCTFTIFVATIDYEKNIHLATAKISRLLIIMVLTGRVGGTGGSVVGGGAVGSTIG